MFEKLKQMRIQKRLTYSSTITVSIASTAAIIAAIFLFYIGSQYNHALTYYAFPQGDLGLAMKELADIRSATRGAIGYEDEDQIEAMIVAHDEAIERLKEIGGEEMCPKAETVTEELISKWREADLGIRAWGVFNIPLMKKMCNFKVDGMTVNFPDRLFQYIHTL